MRLLIVIGLCLISTACSNCDSFRRSYVITQSHETTAESEALIEPPMEQLDP